MRWIALLIGFAAALLVSCAALMLYVRAPTFPFFALGLFASERAGWVLVTGLLSLFLALAGMRLRHPLARRLGVLSLTLSLAAVVATTWFVVRTFTTAPVVRTNIASFSPPPMSASLRSLFVPPPTPDSVGVRYDVTMLEHDSVALRADVYAVSPRPRDAPALIVVHGGSWRGGDKGEVPDANRHYARQGFVVFDVTYRLAPRNAFPAAVRDVVCLLAAIGHRSDEFGIRPDAMILMGRSAGAQIALLAAYASDAAFFTRDCPAPPRSARAVVALYPPTRMSYYDIIQPELAPGALDDYLGGAPLLFPDQYRLARPMTWIDADTPPTLVIHGRRDQYIRPADLHVLSEALDAAGRPYVAVDLPWANHAFDYIHGGLTAHRIQPLIDRFTRYALSPAAHRTPGAGRPAFMEAR